MSEIEAAALGGIGGWFRRRKPAHTLPLGSPCPNCATPLQGPWCHECGQVAEDFHRSVTKLLLEAVEGFTHFDGRFWRTVPQLVWKPAAVTILLMVGLPHSAQSTSGASLIFCRISRWNPHAPHRYS